MVKKTESKAKRTKKVVEAKLEPITPSGVLIKSDIDGSSVYMERYSYSTYNAGGEKIDFQIDWNLLSQYMKENNKV